MTFSLADHAASLFGLTLSTEQAAQFARYAELLVEWNARMNLTAITSAEGIAVRHFLDSLSVAPLLPAATGLRVIDVGTGAGFPGLPLRIVRPDLRLTLLEATGKKLLFLQAVCEALALEGVSFVHARAEEAGRMPGQREACDVALARAVARLPVLLEYMLPLVRVGGLAIALKGRTAEEEAADSQRALKALGGRLAGIHPVQLPDVEDTHYLVVIEKIAPVRPLYPRKPGTPAQQPL
jgi:16S rRNA (guanine527-N7)-methyltransferase